jgi:small-conductance mechanosensitive channel
LLSVFAASFIAVSPLWAQEEEPSVEAPPAATDTTAANRLEQTRQEMTVSLVRLEAVRQDLSERQEGLDQVRADLAAAIESGDPQQIAVAEQALQAAEDWVSGLRDDVAAEQKLYERTVERFQIAREQANLATVENSQQTSQESAETAFLNTIRRRDQVNQAAREASLAGQRVKALRAELEILEDRREAGRRYADQINQRLDEGSQLGRERRQQLIADRQQLVDEERLLEDRMTDLRNRLVLAETTQRIKEDAALREAAEYRRWQRQLLISLTLLLAVIAVLLLLRFLVARYVEDPDRRYAANRSLSLVMTLVLTIGLAIIFLRQFPHLFTGIGVVLAGVAIALQEVILSFFGFFAIRGARGYRIGDWVRIGDSYGEVVDIGLLVTILEEVTPFGVSGHQGGAKTGALIWINNNAIFREKMTNFTRGFPYIWCVLPYTVTFESNWERAEEILLGIVEGNEEILTTAKLARKRVTEAASTFAIKVDNTAPRVRTWTADSGIELRLRFMAHPRRRRALIDGVNRDVIKAITAAEGIDFAYNTLRVIPTPIEDQS